MSGKQWTDDEIGFLQEHDDWSRQQLADELGRSVSAVKHARLRITQGALGAQVKSQWTEDEDAVLRDASPNATAKQLASLLPGRTWMAVRTRRSQLDVEVTPKGRGERPTDIATRPLVAKTCTKCGLLLAGSWFHFNKSQLSWSPDCRKCVSERNSEQVKKQWRDEPALMSARSKARIKTLQDITRQKAERHGQPYTESDYEVLADKSLTDFQKALRLQRTYSGVVNARRAAGLQSIPEGLGDPERDVWVIDNPNAPQMAA